MNFGPHLGPETTSFVRKEKLNTFHGLMLSLAYFDSLYIACSVFLFALPLVYPACATTFLFTNSITVLFPLAHVGLNGRLVVFQDGFQEVLRIFFFRCEINF